MASTAREKLSRGLFVLPTLFTVGNLFCGYLSIWSSIRGTFDVSAYLIIAAGILDALDGRIAPLMQRQPGFVSREMRRDGDDGAMVEVTTWQTPDDCRSYLRNGGAAMVATMLDAFFPTAPYPNGNWVRENVEQ